MYQQHLSFKKDFRIARLTESDSKHLTDNWLSFKNLILENEDMYPGINKWLNNKVAHSLFTPSRTAFVGYMGNKPVVSAVLKKGEQSKICHLRVYDEFQNLLIGEVFFALMILEIHNTAKELHFTLPESLWEQKKGFFRSFGFGNALENSVQYRTSENELRCSALFSTVWNSAINKLPKLTNHFLFDGHSMDNKLLMSIKPSYARKIIEGYKNIEIRKKFSKKWIGHRISLYASSPLCSVLGEAQIKNVISDHPEAIWNKFGQKIGCSKEDFFKYIGSSEKIYAILLENVKPFCQPILLSDISKIMTKKLRPPQSYLLLEPNRPWSRAVSIATLMNGYIGADQILNSERI